jgi:hypothetical protein
MTGAPEAKLADTGCKYKTQNIKIDGLQLKRQCLLGTTVSATKKSVYTMFCNSRNCRNRTGQQTELAGKLLYMFTTHMQISKYL